MTRMKLGRVVPAALVLALAVPLSGSAAQGPAAHSQAGAAFAFGRRGGNIEPFRVAIARNGAVSASGAVRKAGLAPAVSTDAVNGLLALARAEGFFAMPANTFCPRSMPDVAGSYVTVTTASASRTVAVRGGCRPQFTQLYAVLSAVARAG